MRAEPSRLLLGPLHGSAELALAGHADTQEMLQRPVPDRTDHDACERDPHDLSPPGGLHHSQDSPASWSHVHGATSIQVFPPSVEARISRSAFTGAGSTKRRSARP